VIKFLSRSDYLSFRSCTHIYNQLIRLDQYISHILHNLLLLEPFFAFISFSKALCDKLLLVFYRISYEHYNRASISFLNKRSSINFFLGNQSSHCFSQHILNNFFLLVRYCYSILAWLRKKCNGWIVCSWDRIDKCINPSKTNTNSWTPWNLI
jgi:hypothetical protein